MKPGRGSAGGKSLLRRPSSLDSAGCLCHTCGHFPFSLLWRGEQIVMGSREQEPAERDPYWTEDTSLFEGSFRYFRGSPSMVRARIHVDEERYRLDAADLESSLITQKAGSRSYVLLKPYVLEPDITLTVGLYAGE